MKIGKMLKELRKNKNITLEDLSKKSGVALATLSRIENDKMPGTIKAHNRICSALGSSLSELYKEIEDSQKTIENISASSRPEYHSNNDGIKYELLAARSIDKKIVPLLLTISKNTETLQEENPQGTEKFLYALSGSFYAYIGKNEYALKEGDSLYFDASLPHRYRNKGRSAATAICVSSSNVL